SAFRRLKHKTQVFFSPSNDHVCTRIEHVLHVESVSMAIAGALGLNAELTAAIAISHDLGHSPFGHKGERALDKLMQKDVGEKFWHEKNGLLFVDRLELLEDENRVKKNLFLTYAVRDGIISHCGESGEAGVVPRDEAIDLALCTSPNLYAPFTYEACVVKLADRISYLGRDIEDARILGILSPEDSKELDLLIRTHLGKDSNNTVIINHLISDLCANSDPDSGIRFSQETNRLVELIRRFNGSHIYNAPRVTRADKYFELVIEEIYSLFAGAYEGPDTFGRLKDMMRLYPEPCGRFLDWLVVFASLVPGHENLPVYDLSDRKDYCRAVIHYISGMTDQFAIDTYNRIISF
ncbi:MAG: HD domain-containing protein, partial [Clostridia bacterium]|nr:HD domain-containing protein [Clostridia bacterium]